MSSLTLLNCRRATFFYDLGCGTGKVIIRAILSRNVKKSIGIEMNKKYFKMARRKASDTFPDAFLRGRLDAWYGDYSAYKRGYGYIYDISDGTVIYNSLAPSEGKTVFYNTQFLGKNIKLIKKDLPLVGFLPSDVSRKDRNSPFFLMKTPLKRQRTTSKRKWAQFTLGESDATIEDVYSYYETLWKRNNQVKKPQGVIEELKSLVAKNLPDN